MTRRLPMAPRVVVDLNVLVSGIINDGPPERLVRAAAEGAFELCISRLMLERLRAVLARDKLARYLSPAGRSPQVIADQLEAFCTVVVPLQLPRPVSGDPEDDIVLGTALAAEAHCIISGDRRHLLSLGSHEGIPILSPRDAITAIGLE